MKAKLPIILLFLAAALDAFAADAKRQLQEGLFEEQVNRNLKAAMEQYEALLKPYDARREWVATAVYRLGECYRKLGKTNEMVLQFQRVVKEFSDQKHLVDGALAHLLAAGSEVDKGKSREANLSELDRVLAEIETINRERIEIRALKVLRENMGNVVDRDEINRRFKDVTVSNILSQTRTILSDERRTELFARVAKGEDNSLLAEEIGKTDLAKLEALNEQLERRLDEVVKERESQSEFLEFKLNTLQESIPLIQIRMLGGMGINATTNLPFASSFASTNAVLQAQLELTEFTRMVKDSPDLLLASYKGSGSPMEYAISKGYVSSVEFLLQAGVSPSGRASDGNPLLAAAARTGNLAISKLLLQGGGKNQDALDRALETAARYGYLKLAEFLVQEGAQVNAVFEDKGRLRNALRSAASDGRFEMAKFLIASGADVDSADEAGSTILTGLGVRQGSKSLRLAKLLLENGADPDKAGEKGFRPLHAASRDPEMTALLLQHGANPNVWADVGWDAGTNRFTPLHLAVHLNVMRMLIGAGADVNAQDAGGPTPLLQTIPSIDINRIKLLLEHGADPNIRGRMDGNNLNYPITPLAWLALGSPSEERLAVADLLLAEGADPDFVYPSGKYRTMVGQALLGSSRNPQKTFFRRLIKAGANPDLVPEEHVFLYAVDQGGSRAQVWDLIPQMIKNGADVNRARDGFFPLLAAVSRRATNVVAQLLAAGADPNQKSRHGNTALDSVYLALRGSQEDSNRKIYETIRQQLLDAGANYVSGRDDGIIFLHKESGHKWAVLLKGNQLHSSFTLLELISLAFISPELPREFNSPDFSAVRLHRPVDGGYRTSTHDISKLLADTNAPPVKVEWGDVLEFKTLPYRLGAIWKLPFEMRDQLARRLVRDVTLKYGAEPVVRRLTALHSSAYFEEAPEGGDLGAGMLADRCAA